MRHIILILITIGVSMVLITTFPIVILSNALLPYDVINYSNPFESTLMEELNIDSDVGNIEVSYTTQPVDYAVRINLIIEMGGKNLEGKSVSDFFDVIWQDTSNLLNFSLHVKEEINLRELFSQIRNIQIRVSLRANSKCNLRIVVQEGDIKLRVPYGPLIGNIFANTTSGNIHYDFSFCTIDGNITAWTQSGNIILNSFETKYLGNSIWSLFSENGNIFIHINQLYNIGANITGTISTIIGNYRISYNDNTPEVGALFTLPVQQDDRAIHQQLIEIIGFEFNLTTIDGNDIYSVFSNDFPAKSNYNITFTMPEGIYEDILFQNFPI